MTYDNTTLVDWFLAFYDTFSFVGLNYMVGRVGFSIVYFIWALIASLMQSSGLNPKSLAHLIVEKMMFPSSFFSSVSVCVFVFFGAFLA